MDIVDQCSNFISVAKEQLAGKNVRNFYRHGLQEFEFKHKYDCIWIQWVLSQLTHEDAIDFLKKSKANLKD